MEIQKEEVQEHNKEPLQWHPAFFAGIQIELQEESDNLIFENEHQLGTKPMGIDVLIVKKQVEKPIRKNIGRILHSSDEARELLEEYKQYQNSNLYQSVMDIIIRANQKKFKEAENVCQALEELMEDLMKDKMEALVKDKMKDKIDEMEALMKDRLEEKERESKELGEEIGKEIGKELGKEIGEKRVNSLILKLTALGRTEDIIKAASNSEYQKQLFEEFQL